MKKSTIPYSLMQLKKMYEKSHVLDFDCPIQRRYGMWDDWRKVCCHILCWLGLLFHHFI